MNSMTYFFGDLSTVEIVFFVGSIAAAAVAAGFLAGLFGIGGGAVMVPVFSELFKLIGDADTPFQSLAVSTSLAVMVVTGIQSAKTHYAVRDPDTNDRVMDIETLRKYLISVPIGVLIGLFVLDATGQQTLLIIFAVVGGVIGLKTLFFPGNIQLSQGGPKTPVVQIGGLAIGLISLLMGIGGGVMNNIFMTLQGTPLKRAIATSAAVGVLIATPGTIGAMIVGWQAPNLPPLSLGYVNLLAVVIAIPVTSFMAPVGARMTHALPTARVNKLFGIFLLFTAARATQRVLAPELIPF